MSKVRILCFGDSNTWGFIPGTKKERYPENIRYPKLLQKLLGRTYEIIEEGLNSRTLISEDPRPNKEGRNGSQYLIPCLDSHDPSDYVVLLLGTNELKEQYNNSPKEIGKQLQEHFVTKILNRKSQFLDQYPELIIVSPPLVDESNEPPNGLYKGAEEKSKKLNKIYSQIAEENNCAFIDGSILETGIDGVHLTIKGHQQLANLVANKINKNN